MYYTILTEQPTLKPELGQQRVSLLKLKEIVLDATSGSDARVVETFLLRFDCINLVRLLRNGVSEPIDERGLLTREQLLELMQGDEGTGWGIEDVPQFLRAFTARYRKKVNQIGWFADDDLLLQYYDYAISHSEGILAQWYRLNLLLKARGDVYDAIRNSNAPDFGLTAQIPTIGEIMKTADETDPVSKEEMIDSYKWKWLDEFTFREPFDIVALIAYMARTEMLDRWSLLDVEQGKARFTEIINNLRKEAQVPKEFLR